jgi:uncharacterized protein YdhG (YjbR/CyaY superfamily)
MISNATDVETYIRSIPEERRPTFEKLRALCLQTLAGYEECMEYGMPCYKRNGRVEVSFASQKQYISLYILKSEFVEEFRPALSTASIGKSCIRFTRPEKMNFEVVEQLLRRTVEFESLPC